MEYISKKVAAYGQFVLVFNKSKQSNFGTLLNHDHCESFFFQMVGSGFLQGRVRRLPALKILFSFLKSKQGRHTFHFIYPGSSDSYTQKKYYIGCWDTVSRGENGGKNEFRCSHIYIFLQNGTSFKIAFIDSFYPK